jgi:hypothetical protein
MAGGIPSRTARPRAGPAELDAAAARSSGQVRLGLTPRRSVAAARAEAAQSLQRFVRQEYWNGLATGDVVRVAGHTARGRHWRFRAHVTNSSNGATWVEVALVDGPAPSKRPALAASVGPPDDLSNGARSAPPRVEQVRSFDPSLVTPRWRGRGRVATMLRATGHANRATPGADPSQTQPEELSTQTSLFS